MTANPWGNVPDDFVIPVPTAARLLKVTEQDLYAGVLNGLYVLLAPNDRWGEVIPFLDEGDPIVGPPRKSCARTATGCLAAPLKNFTSALRGETWGGAT